jgi:hypothetical protein
MVTSLRCRSCCTLSLLGTDGRLEHAHVEGAVCVCPCDGVCVGVCARDGVLATSGGDDDACGGEREGHREGEGEGKWQRDEDGDTAGDTGEASLADAAGGGEEEGVGETEKGREGYCDETGRKEEVRVTQQDSHAQRV